MEKKEEETVAAILHVRTRSRSAGWAGSQ